jgi:hypothetical protein
MLSILVGLVLGLVAWGFWRVWRQETNGSLAGTYDSMFLGLLVLAAFAMGAFLTYALLGLDF